MARAGALPACVERTVLVGALAPPIFGALPVLPKLSSIRRSSAVSARISLVVEAVLPVVVVEVVLGGLSRGVLVVFELEELIAVAEPLLAALPSSFSLFAS